MSRKRKHENKNPKTSEERDVREERDQSRRDSSSASNHSGYRNGGGRRQYDGGNDPAWYALNPAMLEAAGSISFQNALGAYYELDYDNDGPFVPNKVSVPGVCVLYMNPSVGVSKDGSSAVNIAARNLYSILRAHNAGASTYDPVDYMFYYLATAEAYSFYVFITRIYGILRSYSQINRYVPEALCSAMGVDYSDFIKHGADLYWYIIQYATQINRFAIPAGLPFMNRKLMLYSEIYKDDESPKGQFYLYAPAGFLKYNEITGGPAQLDYMSWMNPRQPSKHSFEELCAFGDELIGALVRSQDIFTNMSGDTRKAYGDSLMVAVSPAWDYTIAPRYDQYALLQIHNTTVFHYNVLEQSSFGITQDASVGRGWVIHAPSLISNVNMARVYKGRRMLDMMQYSGTPADVMEATRNTIIADDDGTFHSCCVDYCVGMNYLMYRERNGVMQLEGNTNFAFLRTVDNDDPEAVALAFTTISDITKFDWAPYINIGVKDSDGVYQYAGFIGDIGNYTTIGKHELKKLNDTAILSLWTVPA